MHSDPATDTTGSQADDESRRGAVSAVAINCVNTIFVSLTRHPADVATSVQQPADHRMWLQLSYLLLLAHCLMIMCLLTSLGLDEAYAADPFVRLKQRLQIYKACGDSATLALQAKVVGGVLCGSISDNSSPQLSHCT